MLILHLITKLKRSLKKPPTKNW